jgi:hypothetical protein
MPSPLEKFIDYRKERKHIREALSPENQNFW